MWVFDLICFEVCKLNLEQLDDVTLGSGFEGIFHYFLTLALQLINRLMTRNADMFWQKRKTDNLKSFVRTNTKHLVIPAGCRTDKSIPLQTFWTVLTWMPLILHIIFYYVDWNPVAGETSFILWLHRYLRYCLLVLLCGFHSH